MKLAYTVREMAEMLGVAEATIRLKCQSGLIRARKLPGGKDWLISKEEVKKIFP